MFIKVNGQINYLMGKEDTFFLINPSIKVNLVKDLYMVKESLKVKMDHHIVVSGKIIECKDKEFIFMQTVVNMMVKLCKLIL